MIYKLFSDSVWPLNSVSSNSAFTPFFPCSIYFKLISIWVINKIVLSLPFRIGDPHVTKCNNPKYTLSCPLTSDVYIIPRFRVFCCCCKVSSNRTCNLSLLFYWFKRDIDTSDWQINVAFLFQFWRPTAKNASPKNVAGCPLKSVVNNISSIWVVVVV